LPFPYFSFTLLFFRPPQVAEAAGCFQAAVINKIFEMYIQYKEKVKGLESEKKEQDPRPNARRRFYHRLYVSACIPFLYSSFCSIRSN
jgi:hypothetical protein